MKKNLETVVVIILCGIGGFIMLLTLIGSFSEEKTVSQGSGDAVATVADNTTLGDYSIEIKSCRLAKDYFGKDVVIVTYGFTNVSGNEAQSFSWAFEDKVYQNSVGLNKAYALPEDTDYNGDNAYKEVKKGGSLDVEVAYELNDTTTDIEVEVKRLFSFSDKTLKKTFKIAQ